jgi:hypothetical protein
MPTLRSVLSVVCICLAALCSHAGELEDRNAIKAEFAEAFDRSDFALIESRYARAIATQKRLGSGQLVANRMMRYMFELRQGRGNDEYWNAVEERRAPGAHSFPSPCCRHWRSVVPTRNTPGRTGEAAMRAR